jgi:hypothetical protein
MKPDNIENIEDDEIITDPGQELPKLTIDNSKYCMFIVVQSKGDKEKDIRCTVNKLEKVPWINQVVSSNHIFAAFFDKTPRLKEINRVITSLLPHKQISISIAEHKDHQLDVFYESRFYMSDCGKEHVSYKALKLYNAFKEKRTIKSIPKPQRPLLNIFNISSSIDISLDPTFMWYLVSLSMEFDKLFSHLNFVTFNYPIILKQPEDMPSYEDLWGIEKIGNEGYFPEEDSVLGYYTRGDEDSIEGPLIALCPENIEKAANELKSNGICKCDIKTIYGIVLIHEYAHALMDLYKRYSFKIEEERVPVEEKANINKNWPKGTHEPVAMEESLANMITLKLFNRYPDDFKSVKEFIKDQPPFYKFGIHQYEAGVDWKKWRKSDKQSSQKLEEWFNQCFSNGEINIPIKDYKREIYDRVFE